MGGSPCLRRQLGLLLVGALAAMGAYPGDAHAYSHLLLSNGRALRHERGSITPGSIYVPMAGNFENESDLEPEDLWDAVVYALQSWRQASGDAFEFDYWQGDDPDVYPPQQAYDGVSMIFFASAAQGSLELPPGAAAYTMVWYDNDGNIVEADIVLNDVAYSFTADPWEAGPGRPSSLIYLGDVIAHEVGHALGVGHSGVLDSTMFPWVWCDQFRLSCDDMLAIRTLYGADDLGGLEGTILAPDGRPILGAQVVIISADRGASHGAVLTDGQGRFSIRDLEPGTYHLVVEPLFGGATTLSEYYQATDHTLCRGDLFRRTFLFAEEPSGAGLARGLEVVEVRAGEVTELPAMAVSCDTQATQVADTMGDNGPVTAGTGSGFALVDVLADPQATYTLQDVEGEVTLKLLAYSLFSPLWPDPTLLDDWGERVPGVEVTDMIHRAEDTAFTIWDVRLSATLPARGDYHLVLDADPLSASLFPRGSVYVDEEPFVVILGEVSPTAADRWTEEDARCAIHLPPQEYTSPSGPPFRRDLTVIGNGSCGCAPEAPATGGGVMLWLLAVAGRRRRGPAAGGAAG